MNMAPYIMNSKDLRAVELVPELTHMGVHSLKIEGRTKSHYVARTAQVYRQAIDDAAAGKPFDTGLITALDGLANRGYTEGFYVATCIVITKTMNMGHQNRSSAVCCRD